MAVNHDDIARAAYARFQARGCTDGHDLDDWLSAERELLTSAHLVLFLPFLRLNEPHNVAGIEFVPLRDDGRITTSLSTLGGSLLKILSGYIDRHGEPFDDCVVATTPTSGWDLTKGDFPNVTWAASLLFLSSWAENEYLSRFGGQYVNSTTFRTVGQAFSGPAPEYIAISSRRRDGRRLDGGYKHGEFKFSQPLQTSTRDCATIDARFLAAFDAATVAKSITMERLRSALPFVELANTDDALMTDFAETILMAAAFEQLLAGDASAYKLTKKFGALFGKFGTVTVADARMARSSIEIDVSKPDRAAAQPKWWVHKKWIEELYDLRSKVVHKGKPSNRKWGWELHEHLLMAAHVFPLAVKLLLEHEGHYTLSDNDEWRCMAVDKLLSVNEWEGSDTGEHVTRWSTILSNTRRDYESAKVWSILQKQISGA
jgi:hypothetical protein